MKTPNTITELEALQPSFVGELVSLNGALYVSEGLCVGAWQPVVGDVEGVTSLTELRRLLSGQFGIRLQSTGDAANIAETRIMLQTASASPTNPYVVEFDQFILTPFTGPGQFDIVERDASDVDLTFFDCITEEDSPLLTSVEDNFTAEMVGNVVAMVGVPVGTTVLSYQDPRQVTLSANATADAPDPGIVCVIGGKSQVTIATKSGITDVIAIAGWSHLVKAITADKIYIVIFVPGDAGDGIYSMRARSISQY